MLWRVSFMFRNGNASGTSEFYRFEVVQIYTPITISYETYTQYLQLKLVEDAILLRLYYGIKMQSHLLLEETCLRRCQTLLL